MSKLTKVQEALNVFKFLADNCNNIGLIFNTDIYKTIDEAIDELINEDDIRREDYAYHGYSTEYKFNIGDIVKYNSKRLAILDRLTDNIYIVKVVGDKGKFFLTEDELLKEDE